MINFQQWAQERMLNTKTYGMTTIAITKLSPGEKIGKKCSKMPTYVGGMKL